MRNTVDMILATIKYPILLSKKMTLIGFSSDIKLQLTPYTVKIQSKIFNTAIVISKKVSFLSIV